ncbi:MAG: beta-propeller fold lactonase family protein [Ginsengibacter sp.]
MQKFNLQGTLMAIAITFAVVSCNKNQDKIISTATNPANATESMISENGANPDEASITEMTNSGTTGARRDGSRNSGHYLYTESNETGVNNIIAYTINYNGSLQWSSNTASGGIGAGAPLGSQGALALSIDNNWLFAVNSGSNSVSSFKVKSDGSLKLVSTKNTWGKNPNSVSVHGNMLYVLNHGSDNIHGFWIGNDGMLTDIDGSTKPLSGTGVDAPQISFTPDGDFVVVPEKATNVIGTFKIKNNGSAGWGNFNPSVGHTPFGFGFSRNRYMIISNAEMGAAGAGTGTSYIIGNNGKIKDINGARPNYQSAPCWVAVSKYGRFAYMTNTATNNISSYYVAPWGGLYLVESSAAATGAGPLDIVVAANNYYVYALNSGTHNISGYHRMFFGKLDALGTTDNLPMPATGLATF